MTIRELRRYEDELHEAAIRKTGFDDFGDPGYRQGLRVLLDAFDTDLKLTESGRQVAYNQILRILCARLYAQKGWADNPEVLAIPIQRPVVITGLPRTGTTALHRLLSVDPQFQGLETWLLQAPMIRPPRHTWETHPAYRACIDSLEALYSRTPELRKVHHFSTAEVEECTEVLMHNFESSAWLAMYNLPTYAHWFRSQNVQDSYRRYADVLRLIGADEAEKRWLLKSPHHTMELDTLLEVFPDACVIQTHRDPLSAIPSVCSLMYMYQRDLAREAAERHVVGPHQCKHWRTAVDRMQAVRQTSPNQFFDVDHRRLRSDPMGVVYAIYDYFALTLSSYSEHQMRGWIAASPTSDHGKHEYAVDSWGVTPAQICDTFGEYRANHHFI